MNKTSYTRKTSNIHPHQSQFTLSTLLWDTLYTASSEQILLKNNYLVKQKSLKMHLIWYFETDVFLRYEINLTNAVLFANLTLDGLPQLAPGRLFTTRMPRNIVEDPSERADFVEKCKVNDLRVSEGVWVGFSKTEWTCIYLVRRE